MKQVVVAIACLELGGCITMASDVTPIGRDTYQISATGVGFSTQGGTNSKALRKASGYCESLGKKMVLQHSAQSGVYGFSPRQNQLVFMCLNESDPAYARTRLERDPDVIVRHEEK